VVNLGDWGDWGRQGGWSEFGNLGEGSGGRDLP